MEMDHEIIVRVNKLGVLLNTNTNTGVNDAGLGLSLAMIR